MWKKRRENNWPKLVCFRKYTVQRTTSDLKVPYYVKENFHTEFTGNFRRLERSVEEEYINYLKLTCYRENSYSKSKFRFKRFLIYWILH